MISFNKIVSHRKMSIYIFVFLLDLSLTSTVSGNCADKPIYGNDSQLQERIRDIREKDMYSSRIIIDLINLSGYVLKDIVSLSSFHYYNKHNQLISENSNNSKDSKHHSILLIDSADNIGVISLGVFIDKTTPLWQNKVKQKAIRYKLL